MTTFILSKSGDLNVRTVMKLTNDNHVVITRERLDIMRREYMLTDSFTFTWEEYQKLPFIKAAAKQRDKSPVRVKANGVAFNYRPIEKCNEVNLDMEEFLKEMGFIE